MDSLVASPSVTAIEKPHGAKCILSDIEFYIILDRAYVFFLHLYTEAPSFITIRTPTMQRGSCHVYN